VPVLLPPICLSCGPDCCFLPSMAAAPAGQVVVGTEAAIEAATASCGPKQPACVMQQLVIVLTDTPRTQLPPGATARVWLKTVTVTRTAQAGSLPSSLCLCVCEADSLSHV
jgi:hypothetical protein